ncbi:hypothetical protein ILFOPFJJ_01503 [Ensifer psoraleae]|nr:hypothetical protein [Sinorhizobium psoraleae]
MDFEHKQGDDERQPNSSDEQKSFDPWEDHFRRDYHPADKEFEY